MWKRANCFTVKFGGDDRATTFETMPSLRSVIVSKVVYLNLKCVTYVLAQLLPMLLLTIESAPTVFTYVPHIKSRYFNFFRYRSERRAANGSPYRFAEDHPFSCRGDHCRPTSAHEPKYNLMQGRTQKDYVIVGECLGAPSCKRKNLVNTKCLCSVAVILVIFSRLGSAGAHSAPLRVCIKPMPPLTPRSGFRGGGIGAN